MTEPPSLSVHVHIFLSQKHATIYKFLSEMNLNPLLQNFSSFNSYIRCHISCTDFNFFYMGAPLLFLCSLTALEGRN